MSHPAESSVALVGGSGSGKTTLLRMFNRMVDPSRGEILVGGRAVGEAEPHRLRRGIGYVPQSGGLMPHWTVKRNVALVPSLLGWPRAECRSRARRQLGRVASKNFVENRLLAEIFAQTIEAHADLAVERRLGLAGTQVCFAALRSSEIDLYPEYTGTGLASNLGRSTSGDRRETRALVPREFSRRWDLVWLAPLGFENAYELAVPRARA